MAVFHDGVLRSGAEVDSVGEQVAEPAVAHGQLFRNRLVVTADPDAAFGLFDPEIFHQGTLAPVSPERVGFFAAAGAVAVDGEVAERRTPVHLKPDSVAFFRQIVPPVENGRVPHAGPLDCNLVDRKTAAGPVDARRKVDRLFLLCRRIEAAGDGVTVVEKSVPDGAELLDGKRIFRAGNRRRHLFKIDQVDHIIPGGVRGILLQADLRSGGNRSGEQTHLVEEAARHRAWQPFQLFRIVDRIMLLAVQPGVAAGELQVEPVFAVDVSAQRVFLAAAAGGRRESHSVPRWSSPPPVR